jgi:hypothetical protein
MLSFAAFAQNSERKLPLLTAGQLPVYPLIALHARIEGVVKISVTTDGRSVSSLDVESGPPMLVRSTKENILTWKFVDHKPTTFLATFEYVIEEPAQCEFSNGVSVLNLPRKARISAKGLKTCDPAVKAKSQP